MRSILTEYLVEGKTIMPDVRVDEHTLQHFASDIFEAVGVGPENAGIVAENLVQGELHGLGSHGVSRLLVVYAQRFREGGTNPNPDIKTLRRDRGIAVLDGDAGPGSVVGNRAMRLAIDLAREHGSGWVAVRNSSHFGAAFIFARQALSEDMIGFTTTNSVAQIAPYRGREKALGTNPLCVAVPGGRRGNLILDMATSVVARGKIQLAAIENKTIPLGWAVDEDDQPTTDPNAADRLLPIGGYKGYGLGLMVEVFSALLADAALSPQVGSLFNDLGQPQHIGHFFGALDLAAFTEVDSFRKRVDSLIASIKAGDPAADGKEILVPGEPEARAAKENREKGIPLSPEVLAEFDKLADELGVDPLPICSR